MRNYITFLRSCNNFREFASAKKIIQDTSLSFSEAREACEDFMKNRTEEEAEAGTKLEFTQDSDYLSDAEWPDGRPFMG